MAQAPTMNEFSFARVTGVGSLPHMDAAEAVGFVAAHSPSVPFWPQLPQRAADENMLNQVLMPFRDLLATRRWGQLEICEGEWNEFRRRLRHERAALYSSTAAGFYAFEQAAAAGVFSHAVAFKGQLTGPITLARCLFYNDRTLADLPVIHSDLTEYVYRLALWQVERLTAFGKPVWLWLDEPALAFGALPVTLYSELKQLVAALRAEGAYVGIHCCATPTPTALCDLQPDLISFDAHQGLELFLAEPQVHDYVTDGGALAFGMIPTTETLARDTAAHCYARWVAVLDDSAIADELAERAVWTATCGLGLLNAEVAAESFAQARQLAWMARQSVTRAPVQEYEL